MSQSPEYEINTIEDFMKIPDGSLAQCLGEFAAFVLKARKQIPEGYVFRSFLWRDDGIPMVKEVHLTCGDKTEVIPNPGFPVQP